MRLGDRRQWLPYLTHAEREELNKTMIDADACRSLYEQHKMEVEKLLSIGKRRAMAVSKVKEEAE